MSASTAVAVVLALGWTVLLVAAGRQRVAAGVVIARFAPRTTSPVRRGSRARRRATGAIAVVALAAAHPPAAVALALALLALPPVRERTRRQRRRQELAGAVPDVADLFVVAGTAGLTVPLAVRAVADRAPAGPLTDELRRVVAEAASGRLVSDALDSLVPRVGDEVRPLVAALVSSDRYGSPLVAGLERAAADARRRRQRLAEERARRLPVLLLLPLVGCMLPAFALLTVAPLIANGLQAVRL